MGVKSVGFGLPSSRLQCFRGQSYIFRALFWKLGNSKLVLSWRVGGVRGPQFLDVKGSSQRLASSHLREREQMFLRSILSGGVWSGFLLGKVWNEDVRCLFCERKMEMPNSFGFFFALLVHVRELLEFMPLMVRDRSECPVACSGMVGCLVIVLLVNETPGLLIWVSWVTGLWSKF